MPEPQANFRVNCVFQLNGEPEQWQQDWYALNEVTPEQVDAHARLLIENHIREIGGEDAAFHFTKSNEPL